MTENQIFKHWTLARDAEDIAWLGLDRQGETLNSLSSEVMLELGTLLSELETNLPQGIVIHSKKASGFIAGADIREFEQQTDQAAAKAGIQQAQSLFAQLESLPCPTVASIHGFCLGGGLELALACDYRIALDSDSTRIGFPEIQLGIFPGFGGTARSIRLLGGQKALEIILSARMIKARSAKAIGLIDQVVPEHGSLRWAAREAIIKQPKRKTSVLKRWSSCPGIRHILAKIMTRVVAKKARPEHYPAPYALINLWKKVGNNFDALLKGETDLVSKLLMSNTSRNLRRVFQLQEQLKELGKPDSQGMENSLSSWKPRRVHVVGAGVMGGDIAAWCALSGLEVTLQDREIDFIEPALERAEKLFRKKLKTPARVIAAKSRLIADVAGKGIARADVIIEAIYENLEAKQQLFIDIEQTARPEALLATNTSAIPLAEIANGLQQPSRLIGLHFFNPVEKMPLVEVVQDTHTSDPLSHDQAIKKGCILSNLIRKYPLVVKSTPGFLVNRVLAPYMLEAINLQAEGHSMATIDAAAELFGMPMGPVELVDTVGLDVALSVTAKLAPDNTQALEQLQSLIDQGKLGKKSGAGFYKWKKGKPVKGKASDRVALDILGERLIEPLLDECRQCLADGTVSSAELLDAGVIFGTGFAPFRGGPLYYQEQLETHFSEAASNE